MHVAAGRLANGVAHALFRFVETVAQVEIVPAVCDSYGPIHLGVQQSQLLDVR